MNHNDQQLIAQKIRAQYMERTPSKLDELRALDRQVRRPANILAYVFGSISAIIMGAGMSLIMTDIAQILGMSETPYLGGIILGIIGLFMTLINYPIHKVILASRQSKHASDILSLSERIMNS